MAVGLGDHVDQDLVQRHLAALLGPPRHLTERVELQRLDRRVGVRPDPVVEVDDLLPRLVGGGPHVGVRSASSSSHGSGSGNGRPNVAEVARLDAGQCLTSPSRLVPVGTIGRRTSYSDSPSSFHSRASRRGLQVALEEFFRGWCGHSCIVPSTRRLRSYCTPRGGNPPETRRWPTCAGSASAALRKPAKATSVKASSNAYFFATVARLVP